jgi:hypothetical protein
VPLSVLSILGDAFWIVAMAMIASATRNIWKALPADARLPMQWGLNRKPTWRARKPLALGLTLGIALVFGLILSAAARDPALAPDERLVLFLVRAATAPLFVLVHLLWLRAAVRVLDAEGALKP